MSRDVKMEERPDPVSSAMDVEASGAARQQQLDDDVMDDDDDPIVRVLDVYLAPPALADQLHLLQYPLQQHNNAQSQDEEEEVTMTTPEAARVKPRHGMLQLDYALPPNLPPRVYSVSEANFSHMTCRTHKSSTVPVDTHMCLGRVVSQGDGTTNDELHLAPLYHIQQMRPSFGHVTEHQDDDAENGMEDEAERRAAEEAATAATEKKPLVFQRKESERAALARKSSYAYKAASEASEEWQEMAVHPPLSEESEQRRKQLQCPAASRNQSVMAPRVAADVALQRDAGAAYVQSLNYMPARARGEDSNGRGVLSGSTDAKSVVARLTTLLRRGWPIPYSILRDQFPDHEAVADEQILEALSVCAVLVRGNFCLHSKFLALSKPVQRARTFLLLLFQKYKTVQRSRFDQAAAAVARPKDDNDHVSSEKLHALLKQVGKRVGQGWELRIDDNLDFIASFPEHAALHVQYWDGLMDSHRYKKLLEAYNNDCAA